METQTYKAYLAWFFAIVSFLLLVCALLNWYVDPYEFFNRPRIDGVNELKPTADTRVRYGKPYRVALLNPRTVIMGNSRPEMGLDPAYHCWPEKMSPVYNLAMPGIGLYQIYRNFQHAVAVSDVEYLVLGLDFLFFTHAGENEDPYTLDTDQRNLTHLSTLPDGSKNPFYRLERAKIFFQALFSLQAAIDSISTLRAQDEEFTSTINPDGYNPGETFSEIIANEGQQILFAQKNREIAGILVGDKVLFQGGTSWSTSLEITKRILDVAKEHRIKTVLFINPRHADFLNLVEISGKWRLLEDWKRVMTQLVEQYDVQLWDFHEFNPYTVASAPAQKGQSLEGFWEPGHYRRALGNVMIDSIFGNQCKKTSPVYSGTPIDRENIEDHLSSLREQLKLYGEQHPDERQMMSELFKQAARQNGY